MKVARICLVVLIPTALLAYFFYSLFVPVKTTAEVKMFEVKQGDGFREIADSLKNEGLIRSALVGKFYLFITSRAFNMKPGGYNLSPALSEREILNQIAVGFGREVTVMIPEGASIYDIDRILSAQGIIDRGELIAYASSSTQELEGHLFPDTYRFFMDSSPKDVVQKFLDNFESKAAPEFTADPKRMEQNLILASLIQNEVPDIKDGKIVAGIIKKRMAAGIPIQVDAAICYIKKKQSAGEAGCYPITALDLAEESPYNTYKHLGLPPAPIGNPGLWAIKAALSPESSPYWYYLSDPRTKKTIFSETLDGHADSRVKYIR